MMAESRIPDCLKGKDNRSNDGHAAVWFPDCGRMGTRMLASHVPDTGTCGRSSVLRRLFDIVSDGDRNYFFELAESSPE